MSDDPSSPDAVARSMGLGGDLPPERHDQQRATVAVTAGDTGLETARPLPGWRRAPVRPILVAAALLLSGYVFSWGDVEEESRVVAALAGGFVFFCLTLILGVLWWAFRHVIGRPRPFGRTVFNYGLVGMIAALGILGADELAG